MKPITRSILLAGIIPGTAGILSAKTPGSPIIPFLISKDECPCPELIWSPTPWKHYRIDTSSDLQTWNIGEIFQADDLTVKGSPPQGEPGSFYHRITEIDLTPPVITTAYPAPDSYSIPRNNRLRVTLEDDSEIDPKSLQVTLGENKSLTINSKFVTFRNNVLTVNAGNDPKDPENSFACADFGAEVPVIIEVADIHGNKTEFTWTFENEIETVLADGLFVFGSARAIEMGQKISDQDALLKRALGQDVPKIGDNPWQILNIDSESIEIQVPDRATGNSLLNQFKIGAPLMNTATTDLTRVFYRRVLSKNGPKRDDENSPWIISLGTEDIVYEECFESFALSLDDRALSFELKDNQILIGEPNRTKAIGINFNRNWTLASISQDWSDLEFFENNPNVSLTFDELGFDAGIFGSAAIKYVLNDDDKRMDLSLIAEAEAACIPVLDVSFEGDLFNYQKRIVAPITLFTTLVPVGPVVIPVTLQFETNVKASAGGRFEGQVRGGFTYDKRVSYDFGWRRGSGTYGNKNISGAGFQYEELTASAEGSFDASLQIIPKLTLKVGASLDVRVLDVEASASVSAALIAYADLNVKAVRENKNVKLETCLTAGLDYDVDASYIIAFDASRPFNRLDFELSGSKDLLDGQFVPPIEWCWEFTRDWTLEDFQFEEIGTVAGALDNELVIPAPGGIPGQSVKEFANSRIRYQWMKDGVPIPCQNRATLRLPDASAAHTGSYQLEISHKGNKKVSRPIRVRMLADPPQDPQK